VGHVGWRFKHTRAGAIAGGWGGGGGGVGRTLGCGCGAYRVKLVAPSPSAWGGSPRTALFCPPKRPGSGGACCCDGSCCSHGGHGDSRAISRRISASVFLWLLPLRFCRSRGPGCGPRRRRPRGYLALRAAERSLFIVGEPWRSLMAAETTEHILLKQRALHLPPFGGKNAALGRGGLNHHRVALTEGRGGAWTKSRSSAAEATTCASTLHCAAFFRLDAGGAHVVQLVDSRWIFT